MQAVSSQHPDSSLNILIHLVSLLLHTYQFSKDLNIHTKRITALCIHTGCMFIINKQAKLHVSPHSYHTNFMSHQTVTIQTSCLTRQLPYKLHVSPHGFFVSPRMLQSVQRHSAIILTVTINGM